VAGQYPLPEKSPGDGTRSGHHDERAIESLEREEWKAARTITDLTDELDKILKACEVYRPAPDPKITIIVVGKRHHTRFYPTKEDDADMSKKGNPKNGTIVDRGITMEKGVSISQTWLPQ